MASLRIQLEPGQSQHGVPHDRLAEIAAASLEFLQALGKEIGIDERGRWVGVEPGRDSLRFTAEFEGQVTAEQAEAFQAALSGARPLSLPILERFIRIGDSLSEDESVYFGFSISGDDSSPLAWRPISRHDTQWIANQVIAPLSQTGAGTACLPPLEEQDVEPPETQAHSGSPAETEERIAVIEEEFQKLLTVVENFCGQTAKHVAGLEQIAFEAADRSKRAPAQARNQWLLIAAGFVLGCAAGMAITWFLLRPPARVDLSSAGPGPSGQTPQQPGQPLRQTQDAQSKQAEVSTPSGPSVSPAANSKQAPATDTKTQSQTTLPGVGTRPGPSAAPSTEMQLDLAATEPNWVSLWDANGRQLFAGLMSPGDTRSFKLTTFAVLRSGNAAGLSATLDGKAIGALGPHGSIREVELSAGTFRIRAAKLPSESRKQ